MFTKQNSVFATVRSGTTISEGSLNTGLFKSLDVGRAALMSYSVQSTFSANVIISKNVCVQIL